MRRLLVDTSAYSAFFRGHEQIQTVLQRAGEILLTPIVLGELRSGFRQGSKRRENEALLRDFLASPRVRTVAVDEETADRYSQIVVALRQRGRPIPTNDIWIAASAMQHASYLITTDPHFERVDQISVEVFSA